MMTSNVDRMEAAALARAGSETLVKNARRTAYIYDNTIELTDEINVLCDRIEHLERELAEAKDTLTVVRNNIPMSYLQKNDVAGATGPTDALDIKQAVRDYAEARWKVIEDLKECRNQLAAEKALADRFGLAMQVSNSELQAALLAWRKARGL